MNLRRLLRIMDIRPVKKKKRKDLKDGPPVDKMMKMDEEKSYIVTK